MLPAASGNKMYMGTAAISNGDYIHHAIDHSDLIILVGHDVRPCCRPRVDVGLCLS